MELLEGASLGDHITALVEKGSKFTETRLWRIFLQLVMALRYLHKEKRIVHRDLSPANLMLSEEDKLTISEFYIPGPHLDPASSCEMMWVWFCAGRSYLLMGAASLGILPVV